MVIVENFYFLTRVSFHSIFKIVHGTLKRQSTPNIQIATLKNILNGVLAIFCMYSITRLRTEHEVENHSDDG